VSLGATAGDSDPHSLAALSDAREQGIHRIALPTPFLVGRINCYLIEDDPLTLIDTGPNSGKSLDDLERGLGELGHSVEELGLIVITHQHLDHVGLLEILARRSGAEVAALDLLAPFLANFSASAAADDEFSQAIMLRHGVPPDLVVPLAAVAAAFRAFGSSGTVTVALRDGEDLVLRDRTFRVLHRPGHSPSDTLFWDERRRILIGGDHLLAKISSNPIVSRPLRGEAPPTGPGRPRALVDYIASMQATKEMPVSFVLGGHGAPVVDHVALIDERLRLHERRAAKLARMLESGPHTAYELASEMWGNVAVTQAFLTISEVLGHMDLLIDRGAAREQDDGQLSRFSLI
jgi:glyoxylase-like metal-dependent hydrolase (beta-lactamase superfamily II)